MVSMLSKSIFATMPKVKMEMATVPAKVPREKISAQTWARISVGRVRIRPRINRSTLTIATFLLMLLEERMATGRARAQPMTVPRMDILMVSSSGLMTFGKKLQSGWKIFFIRSSILLNREVITERSNPVMCSAQMITSTKQIRISGMRLRGRLTVFPLGIVMT